MGILQDFRRKIKSTLLDDHFYMTCLMIAVGILAFEIGKFSAQQEIVAAPAMVIQSSSKTVATTTIAEIGVAAQDMPSETGLAYVGAKSGKVYYPAVCAAVKRVKPENRVYFATAAEAEAAGRTRSTQCK